MNKFMITLFLTLYTLPVFAQKEGQALIDSLLKVLPKVKEDTNKINVLNSLSECYVEINLDTALEYGTKSLKLARQLRWDKGMAEAYTKIGIVYNNAGEFTEALKNYDTAFIIRKSVGDQKGMAGSYNNMAVTYIYQGDLPKGLDLLFKALVIKKEINDKKGVVDLYNNIGAVYTAQGNYDEALKSYRAALDIQQELGYKKGTAAILGNIGTVYREQGRYPEALENLLEALKTDGELNNLRGMATHYSSIGILYLFINDYKHAIPNFNKALELFTKIGDSYGMVATMGNLSHLYYAQDDLDKALEYASQALTLASNNGYAANMATAYYSIGLVHQNLRHYKEALDNFYKALELYQQLGSTSSIAGAYGSIAIVYKDQKKYAVAEQYALKSLRMSQESNAKEYEKTAYEALSHIYTETGRVQKAFDAYKSFIMLRDSLANIDNAKKLTQLQMQYDFDKREAATTAEHDKQIALEKAAGKARLIMGGISALLLILLLAGGFYFYRRRENDKMKIQMAVLKQEALNARMSDHFITNTMDSINYFIKSNHKEKASEYLVRFSRIIRNVLENAPEKTISLHDDLEVLKDYLELEKLRFEEGALEYEIRTDPAIDIHHMMVPPMVFQTLAENAIKHGFKKTQGGRLIFSIAKENNMVFCSVEDNGTGRNVSLQYKNETNQKRTSLGSSLAEKLVNSVSRHGKETSFEIADLFDNNNQPAGTKVIFSLPYITSV